MTVVVEYLDKEKTYLKISMDAGDSFGSLSVPAELKDEDGNVIVPAGRYSIWTISNTPGSPEFTALYPNAVEKEDGTLDLGAPSLTIADYVAPPPVVPVSIPMFRAKIVLQSTFMPSSNNSKTVWAEANDFINSLPEGINKIIAQTSFNDAPDLFRNSPTLGAVINHLKSVDAKVDDAFIDQMFFTAQALPI